MQYKKEEIRNSILKQAEEEFFKKGVKDASLRSIAKKANTTLGNIYNYFENKKAILDELVSVEYKFIKNFIKNHEQEEQNEELWDIKNTDKWEQGLDEVAGLLENVFSKRFYILFICGEAGKYKNIREEVEKIIKEHFLSDLQKQFKYFIHKEDTVDVIVSQFVEGMLFISKKDNNKKTRKELIKTLFMYTFCGIAGVIDYNKKHK